MPEEPIRSEREIHRQDQGMNAYWKKDFQFAGHIGYFLSSMACVDQMESASTY